jgi:hypothetical protein
VEAMRWPPGRGLTVVMVIVGLSILVVAGRVLAPNLAESPIRSTAPPPTGSIRMDSPPPELPPEPSPTWSTVPAASSGKPRRLIAGGARLRLPGGWHGRTTNEGRLRILQAANFVLATRDLGKDPIKNMTREQVVVTLSMRGPASPVAASPIIGPSDFLHGGRVPVGRALAIKAVRKHGRILYIEVLFGARPPAASLLRQTNQLLASLTMT